MKTSDQRPNEARRLHSEAIVAHTPLVLAAHCEQAQIGEQVFVVGAPLGIAHTLTAGHLSACAASRSPQPAADITKAGPNDDPSLTTAEAGNASLCSIDDPLVLSYSIGSCNEQ